MDIAAFLHVLYTGSHGHLSVWDLQTSQTSYFDVATPTAFADAQTYALERVAKRYDVYFGVGLRRRPLLSSQRGGKAEVLLLPGPWLDVDIAGPGHKAKKQRLPETLEQAIEIVELCPVRPSVTVHSGGGIHCYWLLDKPLEIAPGEHARYNAAFKAFQKQFILGAAAKGLHVDQTGNIDRVLRLPCTSNFKSEPARPVEVLLCEDVRYKFMDLVAVAQTATAAAPHAAEGSTTGAVDYLDVVRARLSKLANQDNREMMQKIIRGESFADPGERDSTLQRAASCVAYVLDPKEAAQASAEALAPLFAKSIAAMEDESDDPDNPAPTTDVVVDKLSRALDDRARRLAEDNAILAHFGRGSSPPPTDAAPDAPDAPSAAEAPAEPEPEQPTRYIAPYTDDDIIAFAKKHKCDPPENFIRRFIIQCDSSYYVFSDGRYKTPVGRESLLTHLREDLKPAIQLGVELNTLTKAGGIRLKTFAEVLKDYATGARHLKGSLFLEESHFDEPTETFWEAVCPVRKIEPVYNKQIDEWLILLGGAEPGKLLDWVATVLRLDLQSSALYLSGEAAAGKTMLAHGLARLWNTGGPTLLEDVAGTSFNADISRCPLVLGDEAVQCSTNELRRLVGSSSHKLKRKYLSNVDIEGALRIILCDNSGKLIHGHIHEGADIDAVASKFLHIVVDKKPTRYLERIGGRNGGTQGWVDGDMIAAHAMWLGLNRDVVLGNRLAVEGTYSRMAQLLVTQDRVTGVIVEWLSKFLENPTVGVSQIKGALVGDGKFLVTAEAIAQFWNHYVGSERNQFSISKIGRALSSLSSGGRIKIGSRRYHQVKTDVVLAWIDENMSGDIDELRRWIDGPLGGPKPPPLPAPPASPTAEATN